MFQNRLLDLCLLAMMFAVFVITHPTIAAPPAPSSEDAALLAGHGPWITGQNQANGNSCCSEADGRPLFDTELRRRDGHWEVLYSRTHWTDAAAVGQWIAVAPDAVLPQPSPMLLPVAWVNHGKVLCLALAGAS